MRLQRCIQRIIHKIIRYAFYFLQMIICLRTICIPFKKSKIIPAINNDLLLLSATQLSDKIRKRQVKCIDVVNTFIQRVNEVNPILNCVVEDRFKGAINDAKEVDNMLEINSDENFWKATKPLLGVPLTVKETIALEGMSNNAARSRVSAHIAERDAECVSLLKEAGAIPILVSNTPELCLYWETFNPKYGTTNNPYDTRRTPGGSSGGEGALLGAGASVIGIGSDLAGSIRLPAFFCGVFGHKPTPGFISIDGHLPTSGDPKWKDYFVLGPLARYAEDLPLMVKIMTPLKHNPELLRLDDKVDIKSLKIYYMEGEGKKAIFCDPISSDIKEGMAKAIRKLEEKYNVKTEKIVMKEIEDSLAFSNIMMRITNVESIFQEDDNNLSSFLNQNVMKKILCELYRKATCKSSASPTAVLFGPLKVLADLLPESEIKKIEHKKEKLQKLFNEMLGDNAVLLYPTFPWAAPYHLRMAYQFLNSSYMILFTLLGLPVTQCPLGLNEEGLPIGVQIVAAQKQDRLCMHVAKAVEELCGGWVPPRPQ